jgi:hypothetical protein
LQWDHVSCYLYLRKSIVWLWNARMSAAFLSVIAVFYLEVAARVSWRKPDEAAETSIRVPDSQRLGGPMKVQEIKF